MRYFTLMICLVFVGCGSQKENDAVSLKNELHEHNDYFKSYSLEDEIFGTKTKVTVSEGKRIMVTNSLPNHKIGDFPNPGNPNTVSAQNRTYTFPVDPKYTGKASWVRQTGVALNGVKFEPGTGEVVQCDTGESYRVEAFQDLINLGLDFNHAHVQPTGAYHYHGAPTSLIEKNTEEDLVHIGFAQDGFPIYFSKKETYKSSYKALAGEREGDNCTYRTHKTIDVFVKGHHDGTFLSDFEYVEGHGDLDECNGITVNGKYMYIVTNTFPYVSRCLMGEFTQEERGGPRGKQRERLEPTQMFKQMDTNKDNKISLEESKGPLKENFSKIDENNDGFISKKELEKLPKPKGHKPPRRNNN